MRTITNFYKLRHTNQITYKQRNC